MSGRLYWDNKTGSWTKHFMLTTADILEAITGISLEQTDKDTVAAGLTVTRLRALLSHPITGGLIDSRQAFGGALFVALPGENVDGHDFVSDAFECGAHLALIQHEIPGLQATIDLRNPVTAETLQMMLAGLAPEAPFCIMVKDSLAALQAAAGLWRSKLNVRVIGITGSVGKSTTKELIADVLGQRYQTLKSPGNLNNEIGLPLTLLSLTEAHQCAVLEMGFYVPGEITVLCRIARPHVGVITNIGTVHAERAGTKEAIARGKEELARALPAAPEGTAVLNYDDPLVRAMAGSTKASVFYYGLSPEADLWADEVEGLGLDGIGFRMHYRDEVLYLRVPLIGRHSVHTALRATAVGLVEGLNWEEIVNGLRSEHMQLRLMSVKSQTGALILDDTYNASPESTLAALNLLEELEGRKVAVLGDMLELGPYEKEGHETIGDRAAEVVDELITVGERGKLIATAAWHAGLSRKLINTFSDNQQAIEYLKGHLGEQDVVLIKGSRGMQMDRIVTALEAQR
jgi:UDP-N-acetylmuramoyl-tripeptide--D-alanyl-D-alanine ligase